MSDAPVRQDVQSIKGKLIGACVAGNFMEWFDFAVYGFFAVTIGAVFFDSKDPNESLLAALAVFGVAFLFRPLGGAIFGAIGDRFGRRTALSSAILLMTVATVLIAALPSAASVGIVAPILLVCLRAFQGLSVGGEWTGASAFLVEWAPKTRRGVWGSLISVSAAVGFILGSVIALGLTTTLSEDQLAAWGWRVPFLVAAPLGAIGLYMRLRLEDTPVFRKLESERRLAESPLRKAGHRDRKWIALVFVTSGITGMGLYYLATYMVNYLSETVGFERTEAIWLTAVGLAIYASLCPLAGRLSDRVGRRPVYVGCCVGLTVLAVPVFLLVGTQSAIITIVALAIFAIFQSGLNVMSSVWLVELFPPTTRMTSASIGHNLGLGVISGSGPLVAAWLVGVTGTNLAPAYYLLVLGAIASYVMARWLPETFKRDLALERADEEVPRTGRFTRTDEREREPVMSGTHAPS